MLTRMQNYQKLEAKDLRMAGQRTQDGIHSQLFVMQTPFGYRRVAELYQPEVEGVHAAILYVHWYEPAAANSNRHQFEEEAKEMVRSGAVCLLVETLWSDPDFFMKRTQEDDMRNSIEEVVNLRRTMDLLCSRPGIDAKRFACVGHDFGGMYGVLAGSLDRRPTHYVVMAVTPRFPDWYLYLPKLEGAAREAFIRQFSETDPIAHVAKLAPAPIFFQFAMDDPHVLPHRAEEFFAAAKGPKEIKWYSAGHGLNQEAGTDGTAWLKQKLLLK